MFQVKNSQHNLSHRESVVSLLVLDGNLFDMKKVKKKQFLLILQLNLDFHFSQQVDELEGWNSYMERYTAVKRKMD